MLCKKDTQRDRGRERKEKVRGQWVFQGRWKKEEVLGKLLGLTLHCSGQCIRLAVRYSCWASKSWLASWRTPQSAQRAPCSPCPFSTSSHRTATKNEKKEKRSPDKKSLCFCCLPPSFSHQSHQNHNQQRHHRHHHRHHHQRKKNKTKQQDRERVGEDLSVSQDRGQKDKQQK